MKHYPALLAVALVLTTASVPGCADEEAAPVTAARDFARAVRRGDAKQVLALADSASVARVDQAASRASDQVGGRRNIASDEMLQVIDVDHRFQVAKAELLRSDSASATVRLTGADGSTRDLELTNEEGAWKVRIPVPSAES